MMKKLLALVLMCALMFKIQAAFTDKYIFVKHLTK